MHSRAQTCVCVSVHTHNTLTNVWRPTLKTIGIFPWALSPASAWETRQPSTNLFPLAWMSICKASPTWCFLCPRIGKNSLDVCVLPFHWMIKMKRTVASTSCFTHRPGQNLSPVFFVNQRVHLKNHVFVASCGWWDNFYGGPCGWWGGDPYGVTFTVGGLCEWWSHFHSGTCG